MHLKAMFKEPKIGFFNTNIIVLTPTIMWSNIFIEFPSKI